MTSEVKPIFPGTSMPDSIWWEKLWPHPEKILTQLGIQPDMVILDLCCGNGYFTIPLALLAKERKVYGLDMDKVLLGEAKALAICANVDIKWIYGDAMKVADLLPEKVDCVIMANTFHGVPDKVLLTQVVGDVLKENGKFIVINWHAVPREQTLVLNEPRGPKTEVRISPEQLKNIIEPTGFTEEKVVELPPYHYSSIFQKHTG